MTIPLSYKNWLNVSRIFQVLVDNYSLSEISRRGRTSNQTMSTVFFSNANHLTRNTVLSLFRCTETASFSLYLVLLEQNFRYTAFEQTNACFLLQRLRFKNKNGIYTASLTKTVSVKTSEDGKHLCPDFRAFTRFLYSYFQTFGLLTDISAFQG